MCNYLQRCFRLHGKVAGMVYGRNQDLDQVSEKWAEQAHIRSLTYQDLQEICNEDLKDVYEFGIGSPPLAKGADVKAHLKCAVDIRNQAVHGDIPKEGDRRHQDFKVGVDALIRHMELNHLNLR